MEQPWLMGTPKLRTLLAQRKAVLSALYINYAWKIARKYNVRNDKITMHVDNISFYTKGVGLNGIIGCIIALYYSAILVGKRRIGMFLGVISSEHFARLEFKKNTSGVAIRHYNTGE